MKQDLIKTKEKDRFETQYYAACLRENIPILSMHQEENLQNLQEFVTFCAITLPRMFRTPPNLIQTL